MKIASEVADSRLPLSHFTNYESKSFFIRMSLSNSYNFLMQDSWNSS